MKESIKLRQKELSNGVKSLYLDIYHNGVRKKEYLKLYLNPGKDVHTRERNKSVLQAAAVIQSRRILELQNDDAGISNKSNITLPEYAEEYIASRNLSKNYIGQLHMLMRLWKAYTLKDVRLIDIDKQMLVGFARFLQGRDSGLYRCGRDIKEQVLAMVGSGLSQRETARRLNIARCVVGSIVNKKRIVPKICDNSANLRLTRIGTLLNKAEKDGLIKDNPYRKIDAMERPKSTNHQREFLEIGEIRKLIDTECNLEIKNAFLFSCFTGLRLSDIETLTWDMIRENVIVKRQVKTNEVVRIPLSDNARMFLPERTAEPHVFHLCCRDAIGRKIAKWIKEAGIEKKITFHCARHTFATLLLTNGVDLYTVSKLLGHQSIATTQIYADIIDSRREQAVNLIPSIK